MVVTQAACEAILRTTLVARAKKHNISDDDIREIAMRIHSKIISFVFQPPMDDVFKVFHDEISNLERRESIKSGQFAKDNGAWIRQNGLAKDQRRQP